VTNADRWTVRAGVALVHAYQLTLGPLMGGACRFTPSCSEYAIDAIRTHGAGPGLWLALKRVARCHPFGGHGVDPVPPRPHRKLTV
jgi:putative membrane protein insertion efficiency factor